jgi:hypothetical protein
MMPDPFEGRAMRFGPSVVRVMTGMSWRLMRSGLVAAAAFGAGLMIEARPSGWFSGRHPVSQADARVGRPATATSVAGVARRASRRTVRRVVR